MTKIDVLYEFLTASYINQFGDVIKNDEDNIFFLEAIESLIDDIRYDKLKEIIKDKRFNSKILYNKELNRIYRLPIVFLIYYFLKFNLYRFQKLWPWTPNELEPFLIDCGISPRD